MEPNRAAMLLSVWYVDGGPEVRATNQTQGKTTEAFSGKAARGRVPAAGTNTTAQEKESGCSRTPGQKAESTCLLMDGRAREKETAGWCASMWIKLVCI